MIKPLTTNQLAYLFLIKAGHRSVRQLTRLVSKSYSTVNYAIYNLEGKSLVTRAFRKSNALTLTPAGCQAVVNRMLIIEKDGQLSVGERITVK